MSTVRSQEPVLRVVATVLLGAVVVSFGYAVLTANLELWIGFLPWAFALAVLFVLCHLFYRLVRAVELIADEMAR